MKTTLDFDEQFLSSSVRETVECAFRAKRNGITYDLVCMAGTPPWWTLDAYKGDPYTGTEPVRTNIEVRRLPSYEVAAEMAEDLRPFMEKWAGTEVDLEDPDVYMSLDAIKKRIKQEEEHLALVEREHGKDSHAYRLVQRYVSYARWDLDHHLETHT